MSNNQQPLITTDLSDNEQVSIRRSKLQVLKEKCNPYINTCKPTHFSTDIMALNEHKSKEELAADNIIYCVAGRIMMRRIMGKASFVHIQDQKGLMQLYVKLQEVSLEQYEEFLTWDLGDIISAVGTLFKTKTGELTIRVHQLFLVTKALRPLPEKYHGLTDQEQRYRQRYLDLISNKEVKQLFADRSKIINFIRNYLNERDFLEVETPMMQVIPGGATARPFITHHNSLSRDMYLRVSPELYLKRLLVGGFDRVFEINRSFRNEGLSTRHNPEFTMIEYYQVYTNYEEAMFILEELLRYVVFSLKKQLIVNYQDDDYDLSKSFLRLSVEDALLKYNPKLTRDVLYDLDKLRVLLKKHVTLVKESWGLGKLQMELFDKTVEPNLMAPIFITQYPVEVSPLARPNDKNPFVTDRFELYIAGRELANGFSELNDPEIQAGRFKEQMFAKEEGDNEAMFYDEDYITALEHGMPPAAGVGIGIDRLVMFLTNSTSIRDVILFPHLKPVT